MKDIAQKFKFDLTNETVWKMVRIFDVVNVDKHLGRALP